MYLGLAGWNASRGTFLCQKIGTGNEDTPKLDKFWSFPTRSTLPYVYIVTLVACKLILGGKLQLFGREGGGGGGEAEHLPLRSPPYMKPCQYMHTSSESITTCLHSCTGSMGS